MIESSRKVKILWREKSSAYLNMNKEVLVVNDKLLGSSTWANNHIIAKGEMLKSIMPDIMGVDPSGNKFDWTDTVKKYFSGIHIEIPHQGKELEVGFRYDIDSEDKKEAIEKLFKTRKTEPTDESLKNAVEGFTSSGKKRMDVTTWYKYGNPINPEDFILYIYALDHPQVANTKADAYKSPKIKFFIHTDEEELEIKKDKIELNSKSMKHYLDIIEDSEKVDNILMLYDRVLSTFKTDIDKHEFLNNEREKNPAKFISVATDKNLQMKATIQKFIYAGILRKLPNTTTIVDASDSSKVIGTSMDDAVSYFSNKEKQSELTEYELIYKNKPKN